jgi:L-ascorbate metabolism protein UlaG (beta-lactamase superfamily)
MAPRFRNNHHFTLPAAGDLLRWQWNRWREGLPREPAGGYRLAVAEADPGFLRRNRSEATVTWIGHSTVLVQWGGLNILTDPQFSERASPFSFLGPRRYLPPVPRLEQLPHIDAVLISHNHYDHLDRRSVLQLHRQAGGPPRFFVPCAIKRWFTRQGIHQVSEMNWWDEEIFGGLQFHCVPVHHWSARTSFDRNRTLWSGWVVRSAERQFFFAGDTGYSPDFREIGRRLGAMDLALIPIGHYEPRWFMGPQHVDPQESIQIAKDVEARVALAIHWGTFPLSDEPLDEPPRRLRAELEAAGIPLERFVVLPRGATERVDRLLQRAANP